MNQDGNAVLEYVRWVSNGALYVCRPRQAVRSRRRGGILLSLDRVAAHDTQKGAAVCIGILSDLNHSGSASRVG